MRRPQYDRRHTLVSESLRQRHLALHGGVCPGDPDYDHPLHPSRDLVADHRVPGKPEHGYEVVCRTLNQWRMNASRGR